MLGEIDKDFYCSADFFKEGECLKGLYPPLSLCNIVCPYYHRKYPTPEHFKSEYGFDYPDNAAVYYNHAVILDEKGKHYSGWECGILKHATKQFDVIIVCACTLWGKPPEDWRPS